MNKLLALPLERQFSLLGLDADLISRLMQYQA